MQVKAFYMVAGTVTTEKALVELKTLLAKQGLELEIEEDELLITSSSNLVLRSGFEHEFVLVGDSTEKGTILEEIRALSSIFKTLKIAHELELYDTENQLIGDINYMPESLTHENL